MPVLRPNCYCEVPVPPPREPPGGRLGVACVSVEGVVDVLLGGPGKSYLGLELYRAERAGITGGRAGTRRATPSPSLRPGPRDAARTLQMLSE